MAKNLRASIKQSIKASSKASLSGGNVFGSSPLDLRFALQKTLDPRITFTRASTGTFVGSDGVLQTATTNEARFDHNPTTGESLGLLVEEERTNLITTSEALANITGASITNNTTTAPDGLVTADTLTEDTSTGSHSVNTTSIIWAGDTAYTFTFFLKANTRSQATITFGTSSNWVNSQRNATFDLPTGTVIVTAGSSVTASIEPFLNGWYRCRLTATTIAAPVPSTVQTQMYVSGSASYTGNGTSGLFFWGAQLEAEAFPTSYIPTTAATVTRAADVASITGTAFSSWYNQTEGTIYSVATATSSTNSDSTSAAVGIAAFTDGTNAERIRYGALTFSTVWVDNNTSQANLSSGSFTQNQQINLASAFKINDFALVRDGGSVQTDATGTLPTPTQVELGRSGVGTGFFTGTIKRLAFWPVRLANPTLQAITQP